MAPGYIQTDMISILDHDTLNCIKDRITLRRSGTEDDASHLVCFCSRRKSPVSPGRLFYWITALQYSNMVELKCATQPCYAWRLYKENRC
jgi:hypothetical protein